MRLQALTTLLLASLSLGTMTSCATMLETKVQSLVAGQRVRPPARGENQVYIDFQDQAAEGIEDATFEAIRAKVEDKGYRVTPYYDEADYILWATLRVFDKVSQEEGNKMLAGLGGIAGGVATGVAVAELTDSATAGWLAGLGGGALSSVLIDKATQKDLWAMVVDVQLGKRLDEEARRTMTIADDARVKSASIAGMQSGIVGTAESGGSGQTVTKSTEITEIVTFVELEQRVLAQATSRGKSREEVASALIEKLAGNLSSQLPRTAPE